MYDTKFNVALMLDTKHYGGIETHVIELAKALLAKNIDCRIVLTRKFDNQRIVKIIKSYNIDYYISNNIIDLLYHLKNETYSHIHTHGYYAGIVGRILSRLLSITVISSFHNGEKSHGKLYWYDLIDRYTSILCHQRISVSDEIANRLPFSSLVVSNFIDIKNIVSSSPSNTIAFVGRLSYEKGPDLFISLAKMLPDYHFTCFGDGPMWDILDKGRSNNCQCFGYVSNMTDYWNNIGLLIIPSRYEGLPLVALEAMARGIPVISSKVGDMHKLITNDLNGWLVEPENIEEFRAKIIYWHQLCENKKKIISNHCIHRILKEYCAEIAITQFLSIYSNT